MKNTFKAFLVIGALSILNITAQDLEEVIVTSSFVNTEIDGSLHVVDGNEIDTNANGSLGEAIDDLLGVSSADYGSAIGQPIIRGMSGTRVKVLDNGMVNRDVSALGPDHPNDTDLNNIQQIEIVKGPSSLLYANGSIGGIVNIVDNTISKTDFDGPVFNIGAESQSVADGDATSFTYTDNVAGFNVALSYKNAEFGNFDVPDGAIMHEEEEHHDEDEDHEEEEHHDEDEGFLANSDYELESTNIGISKTGDWGYFGISVKSLENMHGIPFHGEEHGHDEHGEEDHDEDEHEEEEHEEERIFATTDSDKLDIKGSYNVNGSLLSAIDYSFRDTDYVLIEQHAEEEGHHDEEEDHDEHGHEEGPTTFTNDASEFGLTFNLAGNQKFVINVADEESSVIGAESFMNPVTSDETTFGYFSTKDYGQYVLDLGLRFDRIDRSGSVTESEEHHEEEEHHDEEEHHEEEGETSYFDKSFDNISFAASLKRDLNDYFDIDFSFARVERAPSATELFMNGPHLATQRFEVGNTNLAVEESTNFEFTVNYNNEGAYSSFTMYRNSVDNYIYLMDESEEEHEEHDEEHEEGHDDHEGLTLANFMQQNAEFEGVELQVGRMFELASGTLDLRYSRDEVSATFDDGHDVPRITPARNMYSLAYAKDNMVFKLMFKDVDKQSDVGEGETTTDGYQMLNARLTKVFDLGNSNLSVSIFGNNLLDEVARNHSSYVKSEVPLPGRNYGVKFNLTF